MAEQLSARLRAAAGLVRPGSRAADIGCDHGKLSVFLAQSGICPYVIAADLRPGPLAAAKALVEREGLGAAVDCRLGNGLSVVTKGEVQDIVIAGMGAETIEAILAAADWTQDPALSLVLVPATGHAKLRRWLGENGYALQTELPVRENGHWYTIMRAAYTGCTGIPADLFCAAGLIAGQTGEAAAGYLGWAAEKLKKELAGKCRSGRYEDLDGLRALVMQVEEEEKKCRR